MTISSGFIASILQVRAKKRNARSRRGENPFSGKVTAADGAFHGCGPADFSPVAGQKANAGLVVFILHFERPLCDV